MDRLEDDLRRVLTDPRRSLPGDLVTVEAVHRGATRRRRNRAVAAAALAVVVVTGGVTLASGQLGGRDASLPAHSVTPTVSDAPSKLTTPTPTPTASATAPTALPVGLVPVSFTAIGTDTWWVLGTASCGTPPCAASLAHTADGGHTFTAVTAPPARWTPAGQGTTTDTITDVRFAGARDGWVFGGGLWSTHDGGRTWHRVPMPGQVVSLEAGAGVVWAVVRAVDGTRSLMDSAIEIDGFNDMTPSDARPGALAVDGNRVAVLDAHPTGSPRLYVSTTAGRSWTVANANGCGADFDGRIAAAGGGLWLTCPTGTAAAVYPSPTSSGSSPLDTSALGGGSLPNNVLVAPRDASTAALGLDAEGIAVVSSAGKVLHRADVGGAPTWIGFSTPSTGYAIVSGPPDKQCAPGLDVFCHAALMRTTDGGATWKRVTFG